MAARNARLEEFKKRVVAAQPGVTFTKFTGGYPYCGYSARLTFPDAQCGGSVSEAEDGQGRKWYVAQGDKAAWDYFLAGNLPPDQPALLTSATSVALLGRKIFRSSFCSDRWVRHRFQAQPRIPESAVEHANYQHYSPEKWRP
ncbi:hypothetical protein N5D48_16290 [Pseudomonas sp. GD03858]|uniref:hypothetical protein n=1 Tax=unclassified Pseudomonas TaxID=196821 RepID=UPI00244A294D|nr:MULTISPECIES: hypothetical protein [unclassified Pseudomonas]MDH0647526.1 hypothetical protein [Pseudomonas sp. GD03867]MDH0663969.1 hypothetical protein [Pseudomonas sp. GD03858]